MAVLVLNAGSSSLKFSVFRLPLGRKAVLHGQVAGIGTNPRFLLENPGEPKREVALPLHAVTLSQEAWLPLVLDRIKAELGAVDFVAVGHRVVHGGRNWDRPVLIDDAVMAEMDSLVALAPLHQPHNLATIRAVNALYPTLPQFACFDTAFHRHQPHLAQLYGLPRRLTEQGILRYGFHGLSYESVTRILEEEHPGLASGRVIVAHLGAGASLCAIHGGKSVATTMGFTPAEGLLMGTRSGSIDPGVLIHLMQHDHLDARAIQHLLIEESGLLGVSGLSSDMRTLLASPDPNAAEAVGLFVYRIVREIGSLMAAMGGLDTIVFTAGIGENAAEIRERIAVELAWLGVLIDGELNLNNEAIISTHSSKVALLVIPTEEEWLIASHTVSLLNAD